MQSLQREPFRFPFTNTYEVTIPGTLHGRKTTELFVQVYGEGPPFRSLAPLAYPQHPYGAPPYVWTPPVPFRDMPSDCLLGPDGITFDPATYDVRVTFAETRHHSPPSGTVVIWTMNALVGGPV